HGGGAAVGQEQRGEDRQQRGLARAVRAEEAEDRAAGHLEARALARGGPAPAPAALERLHEVLRIDGEHDLFIVPSIRGVARDAAPGRAPRRHLPPLARSGRTRLVDGVARAAPAMWERSMTSGRLTTFDLIGRGGGVVLRWPS